MTEIKKWLIYNEFQYVILLSLALILILSFIYRKKSWKETAKALMIAFITYILIYYFFFAIVCHLPPKEKWRVFSTDLFIKAVDWSFYTWINFPPLTLLWKILHRCKAATGIYALIFGLFIISYIWIQMYERLLFDPLLYFVLHLIPDICY